MDKRKIKLRSLKKKLEAIQVKYPEINLKDLELKRDIIKYHEIFKEHFHLEFEIEHCPVCFKRL
jgi:hypothetical protein